MVIFRDSDEGKVKPFGEIDEGDIFKDPEGGYFMKVYIGDSSDNAICLQDGLSCKYSDNETVQVVDTIIHFL